MNQLRDILTVVLMVLGAGTWTGKASAAGEGARDLFGAALPEGAVCRIGSDRFRARATTSALCFSPDSKRLAWCNWSGPVRIWDFTSEATPREVDVPGNKIMALRFEPGGFGLLTGARTNQPARFSCRRAAEGQSLVFEANVPAMPMAAAFSADGKTVATVLQNGELRIWDVATGTQRGRAVGATKTADRMAFSPDGAVIGIHGYGDRAVDEFWDVAACRKLNDAGGREFTFDYEAVTADKGLTLSVRKGDLDARSADGSPRPAFWTGLQPGRVVLSPDGQYLAVSVGGYMLGNMTVWDVAARRRVSARHTSGVQRVAVSPDGQSVATAGIDMTVRMWDIRTGKQRWGHREQTPLRSPMERTRAPAVAFAPDGKTLAVAKGNCVRFLDPADGTERRRVAISDGVVLSVAFAPDGRTFAIVARQPGWLDDTNTHDDSVRLCRTDSGKELWRYTARGLRVSGVAFCNGGKALVGLTGMDGGHIQTWNAETGASIRTIDVSNKAAMPRTTAWAVAPNRRHLATASQGKISLWDIATGERMRVIDTPVNYLETLSFSPDGRCLAAGGQWSTPGDPAEVWLYALESGTITWRSDAHRGSVVSVAFSPDGTRLVTGSEDGSALVWSMPPRPQRK